MAFPPVPVYPEAIDSDYTLYLVHNTTEAQLCDDNAAWSEEIAIVPVAADRPEIWADNGFGNIEGELFYYDSVGRDGNGKVNLLKGCARNLGGSQTTWVAKGSWVRSYVVAEHHNQIVQGVLQTENFVGYNFDPRHETLDWRIRNLRALNIIFDDYNCPDVNFTFTQVSSDAETGILVQYEVVVTPPNTITTFRIDFGDGQFTTSALRGTHRYSVNAVMDPVVTVGNDQCTVIQSSVTRTNPNEPAVPTTQAFDIPIPAIPAIPDFTIVPCVVPEPEVVLPPIVPPCFSFEGGLPSVIIGPNIELPSQVTITGPNTPINIPHSVVRIESNLNIPSIIFVDVPPTIVIDPPIPPTIVIIASTVPSMTMGVNFTDVPNIQVDWGQPPSMEVAVAFAKRPKAMPMVPVPGNEFGSEFADLFQKPEHLKVEYETVGIPSEIKVISPDFPKLEVDSSSLPRTIRVETQDANIPSEILVKASGALQSGVIKVDGVFPDRIEVSHTLPSTIDLTGIQVPSTIELTGLPIPDRILVEMVKPIPDRILVEGFPDSIKVDMPRSIEVTGFPDFIPLRFPDEIPEIPLVYRGAPVELKISLDPLTQARAADGKGPCVMIVPCT